MLIIADSGSTKTSWSIIDGNSVIQKETVGLNPLLTDEAIIRQSFQEIVHVSQTHKIKSVYFYGAGCASDALCNKVKNAISSVVTPNEIVVKSDIYGAAHGILNKQPGWIAILGTGANVAFYDGNDIKKYTPSLGYILGDEGSGAYLGKELLKMIYYRNCPDELLKAFEEYIKASISDVLENVYRKPFANRYLASFTYFIKEYEHFECVQLLVIKAYESFLKLHLLPFKDLHHNHIAFSGSVSYVFKDYLNKICQQNGFNIIAIEKSPINRLVQYHTKNT